MTQETGAATAGPPHRWLFAVTILTGSLQLFLVQPLVARMAQVWRDDHASILPHILWNNL